MAQLPTLSHLSAPAADKHLSKREKELSLGDNSEAWYSVDL